jgi:hypothetical protein
MGKERKPKFEIPLTPFNLGFRLAKPPYPPKVRDYDLKLFFPFSLGNFSD